MANVKVFADGQTDRVITIGHPRGPNKLVAMATYNKFVSLLV